MKKILASLLLISLTFSCYDTNNKKAIVDSEDDLASSQIKMDSVLADTTKVITTDLPALIDSAKSILLHKVIIMDTRDKSLIFNSYSKKGEYYDNYITNLIFEELATNTKRTLTSLSLRIMTHTYQRDLYHRIGKDYIFYSVVDSDSNKDGELDYNDISSFYISNIDGTSFNKITKNNENFLGGELILPLNRYYFKTVEDSNRDGYFNNLDTIHFYYTDFSGDPYKVEEYFPLDILSK